MAAEIDSWSAIDQLTYVVEWPLYFDKQHQLEQYVEQGLLNVHQQDRYAELMRLIERNRPLLDELLR